VARTSIHLVELEPNDQLVLCTDGLTDMVEHTEIAAVLQQSSTPQAACDELIRRALENGGKDNVTVVIAHVSDGPDKESEP
jgi:protein phosphatase